MEFNLEGTKIGKINDNLYIGPGDQVYRLLADYPVGGNPVAILNVADDYQEKPHPRHVLYVHAGLNDGPPDWNDPWGEHNSPAAYANAIIALGSLIYDGYTVFVHCHGGVSRSAFIVGHYLAIENLEEVEPAMKKLKEIYPRANPHPKHFDMLDAIKVELYRRAMGRDRRQRGSEPC